MKESAKELSEHLSSLSTIGWHVEFEEFKNENHISVLPVLISRTIRFASNISRID